MSGCETAVTAGSHLQRYDGPHCASAVQCVHRQWSVSNTDRSDGTSSYRANYVSIGCCRLWPHKCNTQTLSIPSSGLSRKRVSLEAWLWKVLLLLHRMHLAVRLRICPCRIAVSIDSKHGWPWTHAWHPLAHLRGSTRNTIVKPSNANTNGVTHHENLCKI